MYISRSQQAPTSHDLMLQHCRQHDLLRFWSFAICFKLLHCCAGSISYNSWIPAEVLGWNSELHCYILNIQAVAAPHKVRFFLQTNGGDAAEMTYCGRMFGFGTLCKTSRWGRRRVSRDAPHLSKWRHKWILFTIDMLQDCRSVCWRAGLVFSQRSHVYILYIYIYMVSTCVTIWMLRAQAYALAMLRCELLSEQKLEEVGRIWIRRNPLLAMIHIVNQLVNHMKFT